MNKQALNAAQEAGYLTSIRTDGATRRAWMIDVRSVGMTYVEIMYDKKSLIGAGVRLAYEVGHLDPELRDRARQLCIAMQHRHRRARLWHPAPTAGGIGPLPLAAAKELAGQLTRLTLPEGVAA